jgi:hypothetical protein
MSNKSGRKTILVRVDKEVNGNGQTDERVCIITLEYCPGNKCASSSTSGSSLSLDFGSVRWLKSIWITISMIDNYRVINERMSDSADWFDVIC